MPILFRSHPVTEPYTFESIGRNWRQENVSRPAGYPFYHYLQTEDGSGTVTTSAGVFSLHKNEGLLIAPFLRHSYEADSDTWLTMFATFTGTAERSIPAITGNRQVILVSPEQGVRIADTLNRCVDLYSSPTLDQRALSVSCYALLIDIAGFNSVNSLSSEPLYCRYVLPVIKEIEMNYASALTVESLSRSVYITPQYLTRLFRRYLSCSTYEYLTSFRISKAKEILITSPRLEIQAVAHLTGFADASHFISVFRKVVGLTPLDFRKMN